MSSNTFLLIKNEYEKRQNSSFYNLTTNRDKVYVKVPRIKEIDEQIRLMGVKYNKMILLGNNPVDNVVKELLLKTESLKDEKKSLLITSGYPADYLEPIYQCIQCKDTGYIDNETGLSEKCSCYKQQLINLLYEQSNLKLTETENLTTFNENYYPDIVNETKYGIDISPRENISIIRDQCLTFIENFKEPEQKNMFFCGPAGTGKTFMSNCIASGLLKQGTTIIYLSSPTLFNIISEYRMKAFRDDDFDGTSYKNITEVELLIIDDLGTEPPSASKFSEFLNILNTRHLNNLTKPCKTVISSNIEAMDLHKYYQERITSRIFGCFEVYRFAGEDIRRIIKLNEG